MNVTDLQWPNPGDPQQIARWAEEGNRGLIVARHGRQVYDWDMDRLGETLIPYITAVYVPRKLAYVGQVWKASHVGLYHMTGPTTMQEVIDVPFLSPPLPREGEPPVWWTPVQEMAGAMVTEAERLMANLPGAPPGDTLLNKIKADIYEFLKHLGIR